MKTAQTFMLMILALASAAKCDLKAAAMRANLAGHFTNIPQDSGMCYKVSYDRGVGSIPGPAGCPPGTENSVGLCYPLCKPNWKGSMTLCYRDCWDKYLEDCGTYCSKIKDDCWRIIYTWGGMGLCPRPDD